MLTTPFWLELIALTGGILHTQEPGGAPSPGTLVVSGDSIESILAPDAPVPDGARVIDLEGRHVLPGLIDAMIAFDPQHDALFLASGVTLVRDVGGEFEALFLARTREARDRIPGPDLLTAGIMISGKTPEVASAIPVGPDDDIEGLVDKLLGPSGADFLSLRPTLEPEVWNRLVDEAQTRGFDAWSPKPYAMTLAEMVEAEPAGVLFLDALLPTSKSTWEKIHPLACNAGAKLLAKSSTALVPFMLGNAARFVGMGDQAQTEYLALEPQIDLLSIHYERMWAGELERRRQLTTAELEATGRGVLEKQLEVLKAAHEAGVPLVPGSGAPNPWMMPGSGLLTELDLWVRAGIPNADVLQYATSGAARALAVDDQRGTLTAGKLADFVVVDGNPLDDLAVLRKPAFVGVRGRVLDRVALDDLLTTLGNERRAEREEQSKPLNIAMPDLPDGELVLSGETEVWTSGMRVAGEHYAVVKTPEGETAYCGRMVRPAVFEGTSPEETHIVQWARDGRLDRFELIHRVNGERYRLVGGHQSGKFAVQAYSGSPENRLYTRRAVERIDAISCDSATSLLLLVQSNLVGALYTMAFDSEYQPLITQWAMGAPDADGVHPVAMQSGGQLVFLCAPNGGLVQSTRSFDQSLETSVAITLETYNGPGVPLPEVRINAIAEAAAARDAARAEEAGAAMEGAAPDEPIDANETPQAAEDADEPEPQTTEKP